MAVPAFRFRIESQETIRRAIERKNETVRQSIVNSENETLIQGVKAMDTSESEPLTPGTESVGRRDNGSTVHEDSTAVDIGGSDAATPGCPALGSSVPEQRQLREVYVVVSEVFTEYEGSQFEVEAVLSNLEDANNMVGMFAEDGYMGVAWDDERWHGLRQWRRNQHNGCASWILESPKGHGKTVRAMLRKVIPSGLVTDR